MDGSDGTDGGPRPDGPTDPGPPGSGGGAGDDAVVDWLAVMGNPQPAVGDAPAGAARPGRRARGSTDPAAGGSTDPAAGGSNDPDDEESVPMRRIALIAAGLVIAYFVVNFIDVWVASSSDYDGTADAAVVLGAAQYNGEPSEALQGRLDRAAELYAAQRVRLVVVTGGGQADDITTEAKTGYDYLRDTAAIPDADLRLEVDGTSTYLSLAAAARFLAAEQIDDVILVTDPYHAKRSELIAEEVGLTASVVPTDSSVSFGRLLRESGATAVGRLVGFRRLDAYIDL